MHNFPCAKHRHTGARQLYGTTAAYERCGPILTYNDRTVTHLHIKCGVALGPIVIGAGTRHLPPSRIHVPVTNPPYGADVRDSCFWGGASVRGANVNCRAWLTDDRNSSEAGVSGLRPGRRYLRYQITVQAPSTLPCGRDAGSSCNGRHKLSADIEHPRHAQHKQRHVVTLRYEASAEREARDTRTGLAAEPLVTDYWMKHQVRYQPGRPTAACNLRRVCFLCALSCHTVVILQCSSRLPVLRYDTTCYFNVRWKAYGCCCWCLIYRTETTTKNNL